MMPGSTTDISKLNTEEKIQLAEALWQSIESERSQSLTPAQKELLNKRLAMHQVNPSDGKSWDEIKSRYFKEK